MQDVVEARVEEAEIDVLALQRELLHESQRQPARERRPLSAHRRARVHADVVQAPVFFVLLLACVVEDLVLREALVEQVGVERQLRQHQRVDRAAPLEARVPVDAEDLLSARSLRLEDAREEVQREVHDVVGFRALEHVQQVEHVEGAHRARLRSEETDEPERVEIDLLDGDDEAQPIARDETDESEIVRAVARGEEPREVAIHLAVHLGVDR